MKQDDNRELAKVSYDKGRTVCAHFLNDCFDVLQDVINKSEYMKEIDNATLEDVEGFIQKRVMDRVPLLAETYLSVFRNNLIEFLKARNPKGMKHLEPLIWEFFE